MVLVVIAGATYYYHISRDLPEISTLRDYLPPVITTVYADDGRKIAEFYKYRRVVLPLSEIPDQLINISDVVYALDAFRGFAYPFEDPELCTD